MYCAMIVVFCFWAAVLLSRVFGQEMMVGNSINKPRKGVQPLWVQVNTNSDHVRCFCNLPPCVATGYMCKSSSGGCFSDLVNSTKTATYRARHGCIEYLTEAQRYECPIGDKDGQIHSIEGRRSLMVCCTNDMCNHIDNPTIRSLFNSTLEDADVKRNQDQEIYLYSNSEVWFRAATIAVPICGAVILFVLIALAVKILKSENQNSSNKLGPALYVVPSEQKSDRWSDHPYKPCTIKKSYYSQVHPSAFLVRQDQPEDAEERPYHVPLLVPSRLGSISDSKNAKRNLLRCDSDSSIILDLEKSSEDFLVNANINGTEVEKFSKDEKLLMA